MVELHGFRSDAKWLLIDSTRTDVDAAYAQFEMSRLNIPKDKPVAVQQWQGLIAVNYPARKFGITRHETVTEAKKKCPDLIAVHVATYKDGEDEAGYWPDAVHQTHKARRSRPAHKTWRPLTC